MGQHRRVGGQRRRRGSQGSSPRRFDDGFLRLAWTHQSTPASLEMDVRLAGYTLQGHRRGGSAGLSLTSAPDAQFLRDLAFSATAAEVLAVWDDRRKGSWSDLDVAGASVKDRFWRWPVPSLRKREPGR